MLLLLGLASPSRAAGQDAEIPARQVTLFGVVASPADPTIDPKLAKIEPQLRKLLPNHGFRLLDVQSRRLGPGESVTCALENGYTASTTLIHAADANGKVQLRCAVVLNQSVQLERLITTPPNQLFFCDKTLSDGTRLLMGIGAR